MNAIPHADIWFKPAHRTGPRPILLDVCKRYNLLPEQITGPRRLSWIIPARQEYMYEMARQTQLSLVRIGQLCGGRHHTTVIYGIREHCKRHKLEAPR